MLNIILEHGFLGGSQTFVGVLVSILVICFWCRPLRIPNQKYKDGNQNNPDKENSIEEISSVENFDEEPNPLQRLFNATIPFQLSKIDRILEFLKKSNDLVPKIHSLFKNSLKFFLNLAENLHLSENSLQILTNKIQDLSTEANTLILLDSIISVEKIQKIRSLTKDVKYQQLTVVSAFYALLYGIWLFVCDEFLIIFNWIPNFFLNWIFFFTASSILFWLIQWGIFIVKHSVWYVIHSKPRQHCDAKDEGFTLNYICFFILMILVFAASLTIANFIYNPFWQKFLVYGVGIITVLGVGVTIMNWKSKINDCLPHTNIFKHFVSLMLLTGCWAAGLIVISNLCPSIQDLSFNFNDILLQWLKFSAVFFILLFGIILAFLIPYFTPNLFNLSTYTFVFIRYYKLIYTYLNYVYYFYVFIAFRVIDELLNFTKRVK